MSDQDLLEPKITTSPRTPEDDDVLTLSEIRRKFKQGSDELEILKGVDLQLKAGTLAALVGPSGSGKSTMLHIAGLLERPSSGDIKINGTSCTKLSDRKRTTIRRNEVGFVYQFHHLLPDFTALENVMLPQLLEHDNWAKAKKTASLRLERLGLGERLQHRPGKLSGGEQQRVAIARALANSPSLLLADEPTGNLDENTAEEVFNLFVEIVRDFQMAALVATHNPDLARRMDKVYEMKEGRLIKSEI